MKPDLVSVPDREALGRVVNAISDGTASNHDVGDFKNQGPAKQVTEHFLQSALLHSESEGWIAAVMITIKNDDGDEFQGIMRAAEAVSMAHLLVEASIAAQKDLEEMQPKLHVAGGKRAPNVTN